MLHCHMKGQGFPFSFKLNEIGDLQAFLICHSQYIRSLTPLFISQATILHPAEESDQGLQLNMD